MIPLIAFTVMLGIIGASMAEGANAVDQVPKLIDRATPADSLHAKDDVLHAELFDSVIVVTMRVGDKIITDTIWGGLGDTTRVLGTLFSDTLRIGGRAYFGWAGFGAYLDSALVDSMTEQIGRFAPGGAGSGDIEGVTAGDGLTGGGITGTVTLTINPGWGLYIDNDSIKVRYTDLLDSLTGTDSSAITYSTDRVQPYSDTGIYLGGTGDEMMMDFSRADTILAFIGIFYGEGIADSMLMSKAWIEGAIGDSVAGKLDGINSQNGITGSASEGTATIEIDWPWLRNFIDTSSAKVDSAAVADSALASARTRLLLGPQGSANTAGRLTADSIDVDTLSTSRLSFDAGGAFTSLLGTGLTNTAGALTATLGTAIASDEITDQTITKSDIDTTASNFVFDDAYQGTSAVAESLLTTVNKARMIVHDSLNANWSTFITTDTATLHLASKANIKDSIHTARTMGSIWTLSADWVNTANPWADNEVANNLTVDDAGIASTITRDAELEDSLDAYLIATVIVALVEDSLDMYYDTTKSVARIREIIEDSLDNYYDSSKVITRIKELVRDSLFNNSNNFFKTAGNGLTSSTSTVNVVAGANGLTVNADSIYIDTTKTLRAEEFRGNWLIPWPDSVLGLGSGAGLTIGSSITLGTDIEDDSLVQEIWPEYPGMVLFTGFSATDLAYKDSIDIWGDADSIGGNYLIFSDSTETAGNHRRHVSIALPVPDRCDSLRNVRIQCRSLAYSAGTSEFWLKGKLTSRPMAYSLIDSAIGGSVLDQDSSAATALSTITLGADWVVTPFTTRWLTLTARRDAGTAVQYARVYKITAVWHRTRL